MSGLANRFRRNEHEDWDFQTNLPHSHGIFDSAVLPDMQVRVRSPIEYLRILLYQCDFILYNYELLVNLTRIVMHFLHACSVSFDELNFYLAIQVEFRV